MGATRAFVTVKDGTIYINNWQLAREFLLSTGKQVEKCAQFDLTVKDVCLYEAEFFGEKKDAEGEVEAENGETKNGDEYSNDCEKVCGEESEKYGETKKNTEVDEKRDYVVTFQPDEQDGEKDTEKSGEKSGEKDGEKSFAFKKFEAEKFEADELRLRYAAYKLNSRRRDEMLAVLIKAADDALAKNDELAIVKARADLEQHAREFATETEWLNEFMEIKSEIKSENEDKNEDGVEIKSVESVLPDEWKQVKNQDKKDPEWQAVKADKKKDKKAKKKQENPPVP